MNSSIDDDVLSDLVVKHFPFSEFNAGQKEAIEFAIRSVLSGTKHTIINAPTGIGKSALAMTVHRVLHELKGFNSVILTTTIGLQKQYNDDYSEELLDLKGKTNYPCLKNTPNGYGSVECLKELHNSKCEKFICPYVIARNSWVAHQGIKTTNSSFFIKAPESLIPIDDSEKLNVCIIDECHEIDKTIIRNTSLEFTPDSYKNLESVLKDFEQKWVMLMNLFKNCIPANSKFDFSVIRSDLDFIKSFLSECEHVVTVFNEKIEYSKNSVSASTLMKYETVLNEAKDLLRIFKLIVYFCIKKSEFEFVMTNDPLKNLISFIPISSATPMTNILVFNKAKQFIHMSATIGGVEQYTQNLGISEKDYSYFEIDNPIPRKNRPIFIDKMMQINMSTNPKDIAKLVDQIIKEELPNGNGVIHTVSFKLANDIAKNSKYFKHMTVSNNRAEILKLLQMKNQIILSPSIETGYDFKGDLARWQIIAKVPFLNLGDIYVTERKKKSLKWYTREAVLRLIQASGRVVRGINDYGNTYIIDSNFLNLVQQNLELFPEWFLDSIE